MTVRQRPSCDEDHISSTAISIGAGCPCGVRDANGQALAYGYFEGELGPPDTETRDEARRIAANIPSCCQAPRRPQREPELSRIHHTGDFCSACAPRKKADRWQRDSFMGTRMS